LKETHFKRLILWETKVSITRKKKIRVLEIRVITGGEANLGLLISLP
jgi:hypothetical protein